MTKPIMLAVLSLLCLQSTSANGTWSFLRGTGSTSKAQLLQQAARGIRVRVFFDADNAMWDKNQADNDLTPTVLNNWIVSLDGVDVGKTQDGTGLVYEESSGSTALEGGVDICVRPPQSQSVGEQSCAAAGIQCKQTKWNVNTTKFPYRSEIVDNPNYGGVVWYDGPDSAARTVETWWKVYVKDFCYTLQESDFVERHVLDEAWVRFSLVRTMSITQLPTRRPTAVPTVKTFAPSDMPSSVPTVSVAPSAVPTRPTAVPTVKTFAPSDMPSSVPTVLVAPSAVPTILLVASDFPSDVPSLAPTVTVSPSATPTGFPSDVPSLSPSISAEPSNGPSLGPSAGPSFAPSDVPSLGFEVQSSAAPSLTPSDLPSLGASDQPSLVPTRTTA